MYLNLRQSKSSKFSVQRWIGCLVIFIALLSCKHEKIIEPQPDKTSQEEEMALEIQKKNLEDLPVTPTDKWTYDPVYYVTARNGLIIRYAPDAQSKRIGKLPYGTLVSRYKPTNKSYSVIDNNQQIMGNWVEIPLHEYPYIVADEIPSRERVEEGYVFSGFLENLVKPESLQLTAIDSLTFEQLTRKHQVKQPKPRRITNLDSIKMMLNDRVIWNKNFYEGMEERDDHIKVITIASGDHLLFNPDYSYEWYLGEDSGYYPDEDIILLEGGHSTDVAISLQTGEITETIGNPEYMIPSSNDTYRLSGHYGGQECTSYLIQKKVSDRYELLTTIDQSLDDICFFDYFFWIDDNTFVYSKHRDHVDKDAQLFFKGIINETDE